MKYLTPSDVAEQWGKQPRFVREQCQTGQLVASFFGGRWHITQDAVDAYVAAHTRKAAPKSGRRRPRRAA
jgi:hypothetical protein